MENKFCQTIPLSLRDQCFLHLICHLDEYAPDVLASLPVDVRYELLLNLPAADICQLECTPVSGGINMELIWKEISEKQLNMDTEVEGCKYKTNFFNTVSDSLLHDSNCITAKRLLFSLPSNLANITLQPSLAVFWLGNKHFAQVIPSRHLKHMTQDNPQGHLMEFSLGKCECLPRELVVKCSEVAETELWRSKGVVSIPILKQLFSKLTSLSIEYCSTGGQGRLDVPHLVLTLVFSNPHPLLSSLKLSLPQCQSLSGIVEDAAAFFSEVPTSLAKNALRSFYACLLPSVPYRKLSTLEIVIHPKCGQPEVQTPLQSLLLYQNNLTSVALESPSTTSRLNSMLGLLFHQPQFQKLEMRSMALSWEQLTSLIHPFLSAPTFGDPKSLLLKHVKLQASTPQPKPAAVLAVGLSSKHMLLSDVTFADNRYIGPFFEWMSTYPSASHFTFTALNPSIPPRGNHSVMSLYPSWSVLKEFTVARTSLVTPTSTGQAFESLFSNPYLRAVVLSECAIGTDRLVPALTQGLVKQALVGRLLTLSLDGNKLGNTPDTELVSFFNALFSLPQLTSLSVSLQNNDFNSQHYTAMYDSWMRNGAGKLKQFTCSLDLVRSEERDSCISDLQELTLSLCH